MQDNHANSPANRNTTQNIKRLAAQNHAKTIDIPKHTTGHFVALQIEEIQLYPPVQRCNLPQPGNLDKTLVQPHLREQTPELRETVNLKTSERAP